MNTSDTSFSDTYLQTNDQINNVLARYEAFKRGETPPASIPAEFLPDESLSLIDLEDGPTQTGSSSGSGSGGKPTDDLARLFESSASLASVPVTSPPMAGPSSGLGISALSPNVFNQQASATSQLSSPLPGTSTPPSRPQSQFGQIKLPSTPPLQNQLQGSGRVVSPSLGSSLGTTRASPSSNLAATSTLQQPLVSQATSPSISQVSTPQGKDPFADLAGLF
jgi:ADP-ribosylation factor-binding protein GGA